MSLTWQFKFDVDKAVASAKLALKNLKGGADFHKLFKILYFAEQKHLARYGIPITGDHYIAMKNGPVPSNLYDLFKIIRGDETLFTNPAANYSHSFAVKDRYHVVLLNEELDLEAFAESELECLVESIEENRLLDFSTLTEKSHDQAWHHAGEDEEMSVFQIAKAAGANDELLKYISISIENQHLKFS
jgi:uncharacterized phage-associated protein